MKRFLNKLRSFEIQTNGSYRYILNPGTIPENNELFIGTISSSVKGLFIYKNEHIYCLSHDDFSYNFLNEENNRLNNAFNNITTPGSTSPVIPSDIPLGD